MNMYKNSFTIKYFIVIFIVFSIILYDASFAKDYNIVSHIYKVRTQEELDKLNDNVIEFNEIDELVNCYNATVRNNYNTYEANKDSNDIYNDYYDAYESLNSLAESTDNEVQAAMYRAQADSMRINADNSVVDSTISFLNYLIVEKNICLSTKTLFINYYKNNVSLQKCKEELDEARRLYESAKLNYENGNMTRVDYLATIKNVKTLEIDYALFVSQVNSIKRNILLNCGKDISSNIDIGNIKHINIDEVLSIDLNKDEILAIENNYRYDIYKRQLKNAKSVEMKNQNQIYVNYAENYIKADVEEKYYALSDAITLLKTYQNAFEYEEISRKASQNEYLQGKISAKEYQTAVYNSNIANHNVILAQFDIYIAYENYMAVVNGLANAGN